MRSEPFLKVAAAFTAVCGAVGAAYALWDQIYLKDEPVEVILVQPSTELDSSKFNQTNERRPLLLVDPAKFPTLSGSIGERIENVLLRLLESKNCGLRFVSLASYSEYPGSGIDNMMATIITASISIQSEETKELRVSGNGLGISRASAEHSAREDLMNTLTTEVNAMIETCTEVKKKK